MFQIQIKPDGEWHRKEVGNGGDRTACGLPLVGGYKFRDVDLADLIDNPCHECWTDHEIETGKMKKLERDVLADDEINADFEVDDETPTDPIEDV